MSTNIQTCERCGVKIEDGARVLFSCGPSGTRARLFARVCQHALDQDRKLNANGEEPKGGCINSDLSIVGNIQDNDYYD